MLNLIALVTLCAPNVAPNTMMSIIKTESANNPFVINDNTNQTSYKPKDKEEAILLSYMLIKKKHNLDFGLTQVNLSNAKKFHLSLNKLFDPCENIQIGAKILTENFVLASKTNKNEQVALLKAFSMYNTGNPHRGFRNGYVGKIIGNSKFIDIPPQLSNKPID
jgi:type IV secretion system protein VirB1